MLKILSKTVGIAFILIGTLIFLYFIFSVIMGFFPYDLFKTGVVLLIIIFFYVWGFYVLKNIEHFKNFLLLITTILIMFTFLEIILSIGYFDNLGSDDPIWVPYSYRLQDEEIDNKHRVIAEKNKYGFNDINRQYNRKSKNVLRIAILGDSFVWGDGVEDSVRWGYKLEQKLLDNKFDVEVMQWGVNGWATKDERDFLQKEGYKFDLDIIIVGVVINDVNSDGIRQRELIHKDGILYKCIKETIIKIFPNAVTFLIDYLNQFTNNYLDYGYVNWLNKIYNEKNLLIWEKELKDIMKFGEKHDVHILFVLTPENYSSYVGQKFKLLEERFKNLQASYLNLFSYLKSELSEIPIRKLWANPADGHPGDKLTELYAKYVTEYFVKQKEKYLYKKFQNSEYVNK
jgi:hypothetical protein